MKPPLPAVLYGTGLISAFAAGWFLKSTAHPETTLALAAHPSSFLMKINGLPVGKA
jgi:hypothetical protein